jgi:hypothetical protein
MRWFLAALACVIVTGSAHAQWAQRIPTCGTGSPPAGTSPLYMDVNGNLCTSGGGGGGGGNVTIVGPLGQAASAASVPVVLPSDMGALAVKQPDVTATGQTINSSSTSNGYAITLGNGVQTVGFSVTGLTVSGATLTIQGSADGGTTWTMPVVGFAASSPQSAGFTTLTTDQGFTVNTGGLTNVRLQVTSTGSGTITVASVATVSNSSVVVAPSTVADPCASVNTKSTASFSSSTSGGSIVTAVASKKIYVCQVTVVTSTAAAVSFEEGTGSSVCTGGTPAADWLNTGTTAANGASFGANGGVSAGSGSGTVFHTATANQNLCLLFTTTNTPTVVASVSYVQQ